MEVTDSVWRIVRSLDAIASLQRRVSADSELGSAALGVLNLAAQSPITPSEAADTLHVRPQSITRAVTDLLSRDLVTRTALDGDGRSYSIALTARGRRARIRFRRTLTDDFLRHLSDWSDEEIHDFASHLARLSNSLSVGPRTPESSEAGSGRTSAGAAPATRGARRPNPWNRS
ncbi:MarR family transcriptional regulator [Brevibacterium permense]|uniref:MarR family winged helix-turn-helix transcriptional regulator n=1 Tax=Brevibacterium permense TaxID=234834 RepID=UPI0021D3318A|nr:MarR family transcriptional regulator [Brevibacterium permense]MCU4297523.1 MarR family transcriptional regulator [Brevibacterium permense]